MIALLDAAYGDDRAAAGCVMAQSWDAANAASEHTVVQSTAASYQPGQFYKRELPLLLAVIPVGLPITFAVVDGYTSLGPDLTPALGAHLFEALSGRFPVIGVAKTAFVGTPAEEVLRGRSERPLYVTSIGVNAKVAAQCVRQMHGDNRIPSLIKRADQLARLALGDDR